MPFISVSINYSNFRISFIHIAFKIKFGLCKTCNQIWLYRTVQNRNFKNKAAILPFFWQCKALQHVCNSSGWENIRCISIHLERIEVLWRIFQPGWVSAAPRTTEGCLKFWICQSVCHNLLELICNKGLAQIYTLIWKINKSDTDLRCFNDRLYWHEGVEIWNRERKLDIMPSRQLQPLVHSLLVWYLLLRIPLSERAQNILPAPALWVLSGVKCVQIIPVTLLLTRQICKIHHVNIVLLTHTHAHTHVQAFMRKQAVYTAQTFMRWIFTVVVMGTRFSRKVSNVHRNYFLIPLREPLCRCMT